MRPCNIIPKYRYLIMSCESSKVSCFIYLLITFSFLLPVCTSIDSITRNRSLRDGETLVSRSEIFELGFFSPGKSKNRYVSIWYKNISVQTVVWVANRENPLIDSSGILTIDETGNLVVLDGKQNTVWSSNITVSSKNSTAKLLDTSNLVLGDGNLDNTSGSILWQSFDYPSDSLMPMMNVGVNPETVWKTSLVSWNAAEDPSPGQFSLAIDPPDPLQAFLYKGSHRYWRSGQWNGLKFIGIPAMSPSPTNGFKLLNSSEGTTYLTYDFSRSSMVLRYILDWSGQLKQMEWKEEEKEWKATWQDPLTKCDFYGTCGPFGSCNPSSSPICRCLRGFEPKYHEEWTMGNWSSGCVRKTRLSCMRNGSSSIGEDNGDGFYKLEGLKLPDFADTLVASSTRECEHKCLQNCSCAAYSYVSGIGCMVWRDHLIDIREFSYGGEDLAIRLERSEFGNERHVLLKIVTPTISSVVIILGMLAFILWKQEAKQKGTKKWSRKLLDLDHCVVKSFTDAAMPIHEDAVKQGKGFQLQLFDINEIVAATNNFSTANKLGEGGFGPVYKGKLQGGQEMAAKRLSKCSGQGFQEFVNEVVMISKLQHENLVKLLGCCYEGDEKMVIYEYMPNKSLDAFLFDPTKGMKLDWVKRFNIIKGIARGLLYLHRDSRLKIIHRDLKASNILLDGVMNPKISDFGLAEIFGGDQTLANTTRVVGTYGYMAPEYIMEGLFSEKSDVFSFGVLLLEIVSGKRNTNFCYDDHCLNLVGHAWRLWNEERAFALIDPTIVDSCPTFEVLRCIHVGLLCVQQCENDRPTTASIASMLIESASPSIPKQPAFLESPEKAKYYYSNTTDTSSRNDITITMPQGR